MITIKNKIIKTAIVITLFVTTIQSKEIVYSNSLEAEQNIVKLETSEKLKEQENIKENIKEDIKEDTYVSHEELNKDIQAIKNLKEINQNNEIENLKEINQNNKVENNEKNLDRQSSYKVVSLESVSGSESTKALLQVENTDYAYNGKSLNLSENDRDIVERLVQGEAGGEGLVGAALVAQTIRDTMINKNYSSIEELRVAMKYSGSLDKEPNEDVKKAVSLIFDKGGMAVQHNLTYFYAHKSITSAFHESQEFVVEYGGHRFFS